MRTEQNQNMRPFPTTTLDSSLCSPHLFLNHHNPRNLNLILATNSASAPIPSLCLPRLFLLPHLYCSSSSSSSNLDLGGNENSDAEEEEEEENELEYGDGVCIEIEKLESNSRRIRSRIDIDAPLQTVWNILTDYERLADFIPGLAVCQLLQKSDNFARLFQIGQQNLAFGLKFNAKGIVDCYERELESLPFGQKRDIEFKMIEGDFQLFEGKWSIEQSNGGRNEDSDSSAGQKMYTTLSYLVDVKPKLWLPVQFVEGRLCMEIKMNLACIREEAQRTVHNTLRVQ
ncbi:uncharacterized protein LOC126698352 isoform X1 [Quercus robur]|uniref:uncharacterized protein LOC126698352 isoform X1 n=1 Tax=Quercus robur TaxID=38942 RepID=UPI0021639EA4|nr:uncharacterized protein LOC126698352 isoform X1 [Quercus robur]